MIFDDDGKFLKARDIMRLAETEEGQRKIFEWLTRARAAYAAQQVMERLGVVPDENVQQDICLLIHDTCYRIPVEAVMDYIVTMNDFYLNHEDGFYEC